MLFLPLSVLAQTTVSGTVTDQVAKQPLPGVNVVVQGSATGVQTDFDGKYQIKANKGDVLVFSYLGYQNSTVTYNGQPTLNVVLIEESNQLQEVVVQVGYGSVKKKDATGAVDLITSKDFNKGAINSVDGLLNGRASGVVVTSSGTPGDQATIRIRGGSSLLASNDPLVVIDGLPIDGGLAAVNPNDIESFSILKDASATAIYGNRGSNGVIIITTKKGSKKGIEVQLNTFTTMNTLARKVKVYDAEGYRNMINTFVPEKAGLMGDSNTDWQKEIFNNSYTSDVNVSVLGNLFGKIPARVSLGNNANQGILLTSEFKRTTASFALNPSFFEDHLKINVTGTYGYTFRRNADEGAIGSAISYDPTQSVYDENSLFAGYTEWTDPGPGGNAGYPRGTSNPVALLLERRNITNKKRFYGNFNLDYKLHFFPDLHGILNLGIDKEEGEGYNYTNPLARSGFNSSIAGPTTIQERQLGSYSRNWFDNRNQNLSAQLFYDKNVGKFHVDFTAGYDYQQFDYQSFGSGDLVYYGRGTGAENNWDIYTDPGNNLQAFFGRLNLGWDSRYLLTVNFRRDGSSRISDVNRWANFGGVAFAWNIKEEKFLKENSTLSTLKLRLSYGETGQQNLPVSYDWFKRYTTSGNAYYQFGDQFIPISRPVGYNANLKWERSAKYNVGLDFGFANNRLRGNIDGYFAKTTDLFAQANEGALVNLRIYGSSNIGTLESKGIDLGLSYDAIRSEKASLSFNFNATYNKLELTDLFSDNLLTGGVGLGGFVQTHKIGLAPYSFWVYQQVYDANGRPIEGAYVDRNGDGAIDSEDKYNYHKPQADVTMGFMTNASYKNWDFSMAWRASLGNYVYDQVSADRAHLNNINNTVDNVINNTSIDYSNTLFAEPEKESDYYIKDGSFLKLDNVTIGYNFRDLLNAKTASFRLYGGVQNVLTITKYKGLDPEVFNNGLDGTIYPRARMYMLGVSASF